MPLPVVTAAMQESLAIHRDICLALGIPRAKLAHRQKRGQVVTQAGGRNVRYVPAGAKTSFEPEYAAEYLIWWVHQSFIRGMERPEEFGLGIMASAMEWSQFPAMDDEGRVIEVEADDFIIDKDGRYWTVTNPVLSPDGGFWQCITEQQR